ncbi:MAG: PKD domain-containing protein, partial [Gemmatimonadota bacterium]|nr:PKD domain-containing protein [Gemmatimonadota bacterium]
MIAPAHGTRARSAILAVLALVLTLSFGCTVESPDSPIDPDRSAVTAGQGPDIAAAIRAQEKFTPALLARSGVVGTGVGLTAGVPTVRIFLATHRAGAGLPTRLDDVPVSFAVTGLFWAGSDPTTRQRPAPVGYSIGHPDITAGTLGARVVDGSGNVLILSNNHVIANSNDAAIGDPTYQPGPYDGGTSADSLAWLSDFEPIDFSGGENTMDAGVASTVTDNVSASTPTDDGYGTPSSQIYGDGDDNGFFDDVGALVGLGVMKYGRTTGLTIGEVTEINVTVTVCYEGFAIFCSKSATFVDQIGIGDGTFSDGGDSGSLIVSQSGANPVGLLFAGSSSRTIANRIDLVLDRFGVTVDDGSGDGGGTTNSSPTASFTYTCTDLLCDFDGSGSTDSDGTIASYAWDFGDGN